MSIFKFLARIFGGPRLNRLEAGAQAPDFTLQGIDGKSYSLYQALRKGPVLLAFFKESCPTCQFTLPFLERIHRGIKDGNSTQLWGISQNDISETRGLARELGLSFPLVADEGGYPVSNNYGLTNVPSLYLVNPDGAIRLGSHGFSRKDLETVADYFSESQDEPITVFQPGEQIPDFKAG